MGKMHTSMLSAELLAQANASQSLPPSLINVNEWLPPDIHQLRLSARIEAKKKGFVTFVSHGKIYIKKKGEDRATLISSARESRLYLDPLQTGFRSGHSTQSCLLKLTDDIRLGIEKQHVTLLFFFYFSKAFDSVCHVRLLKKLLDYGLSKLAIRWVASYLTDREQAVVDGVGYCSTYLNLNTGVPQGSVLGPLLFSIYVNDISLCLYHDIFHLM